MRLSWAYFTSALVCFVLLFRVTYPIAQEANTEPLRANESTPDQEETTGGPAPVVKEAKPSIRYAQDPDQDGKLVPVINVTLEELEEFLTQRRGNDARNDRPSYIIHEVSIEGTVKNERADLIAKVKVTVNTSDWVRVPLRFDEAILREQSQYAGPGEHLLSFGERSAGYVAWLKGNGPEKHEISMRLLVRVTRVGGKRHLKLFVPPAPTSRLSLSVAGRDIEANVQEPAQLTTQTGDPGETTRITVLGSGGVYDLTWWPREKKIAKLSPVLEATGGGMAVEINGESVVTIAKLKVRSLGGAFDKFRVRLPPGAELSHGNTPNYELHEVARDDAGPVEETAPRLVEVSLTEATVGPVSVTLVTRQSHDHTRTDDFVDVAGFEVVGAIRQSGYIAVAVQGDWRVVWGGIRNVHQVPRLPADLERGDLEARFEYVHQPSQRSSLKLRVSPRRSRLRVEPTYRFDLLPDRIVLRGDLNYSVRGSMPATLFIAMPTVAVAGDDGAPREPLDWVVDKLGPASVVDINDVATDELDPLSIPLPRPAPDDLEISFEAHVVLPSGISQLSLAMPRAGADIISPAAVRIQAADNVEITVREDDSIGLVRQPTDDDPVTKTHQQSSLLYRSESPNASFAADFQVRRRSVKVDVVSQVEIDQDGGAVAQRINYLIAYEPLDELSLDIPAALAVDGTLEVSLDGEVLVGTLVSDEQPDRETRRMIVKLATPRIGPCPLTVHYPLTHEALRSDASVTLEVPLVMPSDLELTSNRVDVVTRSGVTARLRGESWSKAGRRNDIESHNDQTFVSPERQSFIQLAVNLDDAAAVAPLEIQRAWIQSWLVNGQRQDRIIYRIRTNDRQLALTLPASVDLKSVKATVNSKPVVVRVALDGKLVVPLPEATSRRDQTVELRFRFRGNNESLIGTTALSAPLFADKIVPRRTYWQLILPQNVHLLQGSPDFTFEFNWHRQNIYWRRLPAMEQPELETWVGATNLREQPSRATNRYLFSTLGPAEELRVYTAQRWLVVLITSGGTLIVGLLLLNIRALRHPGILFFLAAGALTTAVIFPDSTMILAQAAGFGVFLSALAFWLKHTSERRRRSVVVGSGSQNAVVELGSNRTTSRSPGAGSYGSTNLAPTVAELAIPDSKS